jgi:WhiB family redox-sensing transcriptional regulator
MFAEVQKHEVQGPQGAWRDQAACHGCPPAMFFPSDERDDAEPKAVCADCPVRIDCLFDALLSRETEGIRGGLNERERKSLVRRARRSVRLGRSPGLVAALSAAVAPSASPAASYRSA